MKGFEYKVISEHNLINSCRKSFDLNYKVAVFVHLHYVEDVEEYSYYLNSIPGYINLYISYCDDSVRKKCMDYVTHERVTYVKKNNRGRDISALLVAFRKYILQYDFFCFVHDKRAKSEYRLNDISEWKKLLWECCLGGADYIENVIDFFIQSPQTGALFPPMLVTENNGRCFDIQWGKNYENTCELAQKIGITKYIDPNVSPMSQGTCFWARTEAVKRIIDIEWNYDDFDDEPLAGDGTISHAIERIFQYVAEDAGYQALFLIKDTYCERYLKNMQIVETKMYSILSSFGINDVRFMNNWESRLLKVNEFIKNHDRVYCYGAGRFSQAVTCLLALSGRLPYAYVVSDNFGANCAPLEMIRLLNEIEINDKDGYIIGTKEESYAEIESRLRDFGVKEDDILKLL